MALKANRVGVAPTEVDALGHIIGGDVPSDVLTVNDIVDSLQSMDATKVLSAKQGNTLNSKLRTSTPTGYHSFWFAYDSETDRYGYKVDNDPNQFHPFSSGSSATLGINVLEPVTTDISTYGDTEILEGGYQIDNNIAYINMKIKISGAKTQGTSLMSLYSAIQPKQIRLLLPTNKVTYNEQEIRANGNLTDGEEITIAGVAY